MIVNGILFSCYSDRKTITVPSGVSRIDGTAFFDCFSMEYVELPTSLHIIGERAFALCNKLKEIVIPDTVTTIADFAFDECASLAHVTISSKSISISNTAFRRCSALMSVYAPYIPLRALTELRLQKPAVAFFRNHPEANYDPAVRNDYL